MFTCKRPVNVDITWLEAVCRESWKVSHISLKVSFFNAEYIVGVNRLF